MNHVRSVFCGRWEAYPREFAKCRGCRKAKYCGKEYQSTAWSEDFGVVQRMLMKMDTKGHHDRDRDHY